MEIKLGKKIIYGLSGNPQAGEIVLIGKYSVILKNTSLITEDVLLEEIKLPEFYDIKNAIHNPDFVADSKERLEKYYQSRIDARRYENKIDENRLKTAIELLTHL